MICDTREQERIKLLQKLILKLRNELEIAIKYNDLWNVLIKELQFTKHSTNLDDDEIRNVIE